MGCKTEKGFINKLLTGSGRESDKRHTERIAGTRKPTKTQIKKIKKAQERMIEMQQL